MESGSSLFDTCQICKMCTESRIVQNSIIIFSPPANEVWVKVIFLQACVSHSVHRWGLCMMSYPVWLPGLMFLLGGLCPGGLCPRGVSVQEGSQSRGVSVQGVSVWGSLSEGSPPRTETPLYGEEWAVCILLECFSVRIAFAWFLRKVMSKIQSKFHF